MPENSTNTFTGKVPEVKIGETQTGTMFISLESLDGSHIATNTPITARALYINSAPLRFQPAVGDNDEILTEKHLINTLPTIDPNTGRYSVSLVFDTEGQKMFGDITGRNIGKSIAIFLGNQLLTEASVSQRIDGNAIITP